MRQYHGHQSTSSALPKSFHLLPQQVVKQKASSKTKKTKKQKAPETMWAFPAIFLNFFLFFSTPYRVNYESHCLSLIILSTSLKSTLQVFVKRTIEQVNSSQTSTQWSTSSDCFSLSFESNKVC